MAGITKRPVASIQPKFPVGGGGGIKAIAEDVRRLAEPKNSKRVVARRRARIDAALVLRFVNA